ncbi:MAG: acetyltransferase [Lysobacteraceae bacterium]|nr:MAG: acetyltransferase [Xanthomonadaceae bacterium]
MTQGHRSLDVHIRAAEAADASDITDLYGQRHAYEGTLQLPFPSRRTWTERLANQAENIHYLVAVSESRLLGQLTLATHTRPRRKHVAELGMGVCSSSLRRGVGSALLQAALAMCDQWLNIVRVELDVYTDNSAALALYKKHGFVIEGEHRKSAFRDGHFVDVFSMARVQ